MENYIDKSFDNQFQQTGQIKWLPWVGKNYSIQNNVRVLVVGESNYQWEDDEETEEEVKGYLEKGIYNRKVIHNYLIGRRTRIYQNLSKTLLFDEKPTEENKTKLWQLLSYYNFVQTRYMTSIKDRPSLEDWQFAWKTFFKVVDILRPNHIIFCGVLASNEQDSFKQAAIDNHFEIVSGISREKEIGNIAPRFATIKRENENEIPIAFIKHPSAFFSYEAWAELLHKRSPEFYKELCGLCIER